MKLDEYKKKMKLEPDTEEIDSDIDMDTKEGHEQDQDFEKMYLDLLDNMDNAGFALQLQAKQSRARYLANRNMRRRMATTRNDKQQQQHRSKQ